MGDDIILAQDMGYVLVHSLFAEKQGIWASKRRGEKGYTFLADLLRHVSVTDCEKRNQYAHSEW